MILDVGDPASNFGLNSCFWLIIALALISILPWKSLGAPRLSFWARWTWLPVVVLAIAYEGLMPSRFDIRIDLLLLLPLYALVLLACAIRWWRRAA